MKRIFILVSLLALAVFGTWPNIKSTQASTTFTVNSLLDEVDAHPGDGRCASVPSGKCTLRAAVMETNALAGANTINLPAGTYVLTIPGTGEDQAATGDLDINSDLALVGAGADTTIIDGNHLDRVIQVGNSATVTISGVTIRNGQPPAAISAINHGGGLRSGGNLTLLNTIFTANYTAVDGGAIDSYGPLSIDRSSIFSNSTGLGGAGIFNENIMTITNSSIYSNTTPSHGGGIWNNGIATIINSTVRGNSGDLGAGIYHIGQKLTVINSTISDNYSDGVFASGGTAILINDTLSGHSGTAVDGYQATATLWNTTVTNNYVGADVTQGTVQVGNSILAGNTLADCGGGAVVSVGYNLIQSWDNPGFPCMISGVTTGNILNIDPHLGPLQDNGGPTWTHMPAADSDALNAGNPAGCADDLGHLLVTDQRGVARPQGARCDIGAVERVLGCGLASIGPGLVFKLFLPLVMRAAGTICP